MRFDQYIGTTKGLPPNIDVNGDNRLFRQMADFITSLEPNQLTPTQTNQIANIIAKLKFDMR